MWFMAVYSKAWLLLWNTGSSLSLREEDSSLRSGSTRLRQLLHGRGSISHRFTMPTDHSRTDLMPDGMVERMSPWAKDQVGLSNPLIEIGWEDWASDKRALSIGSVLYDAKSQIEGPWTFMSRPRRS